MITPLMVVDTYNDFGMWAISIAFVLKIYDKFVIPSLIEDASIVADKVNDLLKKTKSEDMTNYDIIEYNGKIITLDKMLVNPNKSKLSLYKDMNIRDKYTPKDMSWDFVKVGSAYTALILFGNAIKSVL